METTKKSQIVGIKNAGIVIICCFIIAVCIYHFLLGNPSNFMNNDPNNHPLPGNFLGTIYKGGIIVPVIQTLLLTVLALSIERYFALRSAFGKGSLAKFVANIKAALAEGDIKKAQEICDNQRGSADMREEEKRKVRIAAGGLQSIWRLRPLLNPFRYGVLSFQYTSHRVLRWSVTPFLLFALLPLNVAILLTGGSPVFYGVLFVLQVFFYGLGYWGYYLSTRQIKNKLLFIPYYFLFMNINVLRGIRYLKKKRGSGTWEKAKRAEK